MSSRKIRVTPGGPYIVTGGVPLSEKIITPTGSGYIYTEGRTLPQSETYALCRCGRSKNPPFCDGSHAHAAFNSQETAPNSRYLDRAERLEGRTLDLLDDHRCALARFCHREHGDAWELLSSGDTDEIITAASECPTGRLTAVTKDGRLLEPELEPGIDVLQDPEQLVSAGLYVRGGIPIESAGGEQYEVRNRVVLCRCGRSKLKPFCDAAHAMVGFTDQRD